MVVSRRSFVARKSAVVGIQSAIRGYLQRQQYVRQLQQIVRLQCVMRSWLVRRQCNRLRTLRTAAATCIQAHVRGYWCRKQLAMQQQQRAVRLVQIVLTVRKHLAAVRIQRTFRKYRSILHAKHNIDSVVTIQRWMQVLLQRRHYVRIHSSLCRLQLLARDWLTVRQNSAALIQRTYKQYTARQQIKRMQGSATSIQALWRGYRLRRQVKDKKIHEARLKVQQATRNVKEENKLCHRTSSALDFLLTYKQLSQVLEALINLDVVTRLSPQCCQRLVEGNAVGVLYRLMHSCNRSLPHMELIRYAINILLNLSKYEVTSAAVFEPADSLEVLVELLQIYREKGPIFTNTCMLLGIMGFDSTRRQFIHTKSQLVEKLRSLHTLTVRKHQLDHKRLSAKTKTLGVCYPASRQSISPAWSMRRNTVHYIDDPLNAVTFMMTSLQIQPK